MNFIITRLVDQKTKNPIWRIHPVGNFHATLILLKEKDVKDLLVQIIDQDATIAHHLKKLLESTKMSKSFE